VTVWVTIGGLMAAFLALMAGLRAYAASASPRPDATRKLLHLGSGLLTLWFPFVFSDLWPVFLLTVSVAALLAAIKLEPRCRGRLGTLLGAGDRTTFGELYFPIAVAAVFWLSARESPLQFVIPILVLSVADAAGAVVGMRYGVSRYLGGAKSLEGSAAVAGCAFVCTYVPLRAWGGLGVRESILIAETLALAVMLIEAGAWRGLDNLFVPIGAALILRALLPLDLEAVQLRLYTTIAVAVLLLLAGQQSFVSGSPLGRAAIRAAIAAWTVFLAYDPRS
jgi:phytol kinase